MVRNHGVLIAIATGVAVAGTSYAASAVLFRNSRAVTPQKTENTPPVEDVQLATPPISESPVISQPKASTPQDTGKERVNQPDDAVDDAVSTDGLITDLTPVYAEQQANPDLAKAILKELPGYSCMDDAPIDTSALRYFYTFADLNQDGNQEAIAYLVGPYACGTGGCTALIFDVDGSEYTLNSQITVAQNPIVVTDQQTDGWRDLVIPVSGGGATPGYHVLRWNGTSYAANPSVAPEWTKSTLEGKALIADSIAADTSAPKLADDACSAETE